MSNSLFLQSQVPDPYALYIERLAESPVFWDAANQLWLVYDYRSCREVLSHPAGQIPPVSMDGLSDYALAIAGRLARISNGKAHAAARQAAMQLMQCMKEAPVQGILQELLLKRPSAVEIDWVEMVGRRLPTLSTLAAFELEGDAASFIAQHTGTIIKIMQPVKTADDVAAVNAVAKEIYQVLEQHMLQKHFLANAVQAVAADCSISTEEALLLCVGNLAGLLIQGYDAVRGLLSNSLLQLLRQPAAMDLHNLGSDYLQRCVLEVLRFDPPVHNTRRIAGEQIVLGDHTIAKGQAVLVVMAAANRDQQQFAHPNCFNPERPNNATHMTFGVGAHACVGNRFSLHITTEALSYLFQHYRHVRLLETAVEYESLVNLRLPKQLRLGLS